MEWIAILFFLAFGAAYLLARRRGGSELSSTLVYHVSFSTDEVMRGEYLYLDQSIENISDRTVPFLRVETLLPEGLSILLDTSEKVSGRGDEAVRSTEALWVLHPHCKVTRRWRLVAGERGAYTTRDVQMIAISNDPIGMGAFSVALEPADMAQGYLQVLPAAAEWLTGMAPAPAPSGTTTVPQGLIRDPMSIIGVRDYEPYDPLSMVDWKQSARLGHLMVRQTEAVVNDSFNIVLNMQSVLLEAEHVITTPALIEDCITVCASLLDSAIRRNIPVRLIANTDPAGMDGAALRPTGVGKELFCSEEFRDGEGTMEAYRMLARIPMTRSVAIETVLDDMVENPWDYARGGNILFVTSYLDSRMVNAHRMLAEQGIKMRFYVMTTDHHTGGGEQLPLPEEDVFFKHTTWIGGVRYGL